VTFRWVSPAQPGAQTATPLLQKRRTIVPVHLPSFNLSAFATRAALDLHIKAGFASIDATPSVGKQPPLPVMATRTERDRQQPITSSSLTTHTCSTVSAILQVRLPRLTEQAAAERRERLRARSQGLSSDSRIKVPLPGVGVSSGAHVPHVERQDSPLAPGKRNTIARPRKNRVYAMSASSVGSMIRPWR
jgi:hypothetical protein